MVGAIGLLGIVLSVESLRTVFGFAALHVDDLLLAFGTGLLTLLWMEAWKRVLYRRPVAAASPQVS